MFPHKLSVFATARHATSALQRANSSRDAGQNSMQKRSHVFLSRILTALGGKKLLEMQPVVYEAVLPAFKPEIIEHNDIYLLVESILACLAEFEHFESVRDNMERFQQVMGISDEAMINRRLFKRYQTRWWAPYGVESVEDMLTCDIDTVGAILSAHSEDKDLACLFDQIAVNTVF
jgi:hypothetical protein